MLACQATQAGGIGSLESILGRLKNLKILDQLFMTIVSVSDCGVGECLKKRPGAGVSIRDFDLLRVLGTGGQLTEYETTKRKCKK